MTFDSAQVTSYPSDAAGGNLRTVSADRLHPGRRGGRGTYKVPPRKKGEREESPRIGTAPTDMHALRA